MKHCWADNIEWAEETYGLSSPERAQAVVDGHATCMLPAGHEGAHVWTPDDDIVVTFPEKEGERP